MDGSGILFDQCWVFPEICAPHAAVYTEPHALGGWVTVTGENFTPGRQLIIRFKDTLAQPIVVYTASTDAKGSFSTTLNVQYRASRNDANAYRYRPADVYIQDPLMGEVPAGATYAFVC